jgi:hypothetical protein
VLIFLQCAFVKCARNVRQTLAVADKFRRLMLVLPAKEGLMLLVLHPFLLAVYLVAFVLAGNVGEASLSDAWRAAATLVGIAGVLLLLVRCVVSRWAIAGFIVTLALAVAFLHEPIINIWVSLLPEHTAAILATELCVVVGLSYLAIRKISNWGNVTRTLNVSVGALLLLSGFQVVVNELSSPAQMSLPSNSSSSFTLAMPDSKPDVYYILLDAYARDDALRDYYDHDNSEFTGFLKDKGFYIASDSTANYSMTRAAAPAVLNFDYVDSWLKEENRGQATSAELTAATFDSKLANLFRSNDYRIVNILSGIKFIKLGDAETFELNVVDTGLNEFELAMLNMTALSVFKNQVFRQL